MAADPSHFVATTVTGPFGVDTGYPGVGLQAFEFHRVVSAEPAPAGRVRLTGVPGTYEDTG